MVQTDNANNLRTVVGGGAAAVVSVALVTVSVTLDPKAIPGMVILSPVAFPLDEPLKATVGVNESFAVPMADFPVVSGSISKACRSPLCTTMSTAKVAKATDNFIILLPNAVRVSFVI